MMHSHSHLGLAVVCLALPLACSERPQKDPAAAAPAEEPLTGRAEPDEPAPSPVQPERPETPEELRDRLKAAPSAPKGKELRAEGPPKIDLSCDTATDCAVKNVGNCCGYYPRCVNVGFEPDPEAVKRQCEREGRMGVCGFPEIQACACRENRCVSITASGK